MSCNTPKKLRIQKQNAIVQVNVHAIIDDPLLQDGMQARWDHRRVQQYVASTVNELQPVVVRRIFQCAAIAISYTYNQ